ncbi:hypothetical protein CVT26_006598 [Gymnopilus dilepis]|uniref:Uncharacterized protein n=1 Tax=Gymnopilus dilepis TaxID=231916 RepID=A0A409Y2Z9_9AGAR|nr:hypothetical protein CVT26_006598 [Gymnopilus dilepis]
MSSDNSIQHAPRVRSVPLPPVDVDYHDDDVLRLSLTNPADVLPQLLILSPYRPDTAGPKHKYSKNHSTKLGLGNETPLTLANVPLRRVVYPRPLGDVNNHSGRKIG